jgi:hypothetical protein
VPSFPYDALSTVARVVPITLAASGFRLLCNPESLSFIALNISRRALNTAVVGINIPVKLRDDQAVLPSFEQRHFSLIVKEACE